jgi:hypothetical protein
MEKWLPGSPPHDCHGEANEIRALKGAQHLPSCFRRNDKEGNRDNIKIGGLPDGSFNADTGFKFFDPAASANDYAIAVFFLRSFLAGRFRSCSGFHDLDPKEA